MIWLLLAGALVVVSVALRRAFVRLDEQKRAIKALGDRLDLAEERRLRAQLEATPSPEAPPRVDVAPTHSSVDVERVPLRVEIEPTPPAPAPIAATKVFERAPLQEPAPHPAEAEAETLETRIGTRWLLYIGVIAIIVGVSYFEKLAMEMGWIGERARVIQGAAVGAALVYAGTRFVRAGYALYGQMLSGCGIAVLYLSTYAAFSLYQLIDRPLAFGMMIAITALGAWLADGQRSQGLALLAASGGFATPFLLPGTSPAETALFSYDVILVGGTVLLSRRRDWPFLNVVSYLFTALTVAAWAGSYYTAEAYLRTEMFVTLFCAMFLYILYTPRDVESPAGRTAQMILWTTPAAYYLASLAILLGHPTPLLVWLVALMLAGGILTVRAGAAACLVVWAAATVPLLLFIQNHASDVWFWPAFWALGGVYAIALIAQLYVADQHEGRLGPADVALLHANGLAAFAGAYILIDAVHLSLVAPATAAFAFWQGGLAAVFWIRRRELALHFAALGFTLLMMAIALQFDGAGITVGWAAEGAAVIALGFHERRAWLRNCGVLLFAVAVGRTLALLFATAPIDQVLFLNRRAACAAFVIALAYALAWLYRRDPDAGDRGAMIGASLLTAQFVTLALLTSEIDVAFIFAHQLMTSVTWAVFATVLIVIGLRKRYAPIRYFAIATFALTILKVYFLDLSELNSIYRVSSVIGLGVLLLLTSYLYTRSQKP